MLSAASTVGLLIAFGHGHDEALDIAALRRPAFLDHGFEPAVNHPRTVERHRVRFGIDALIGLHELFHLLFHRVEEVLVGPLDPAERYRFVILAGDCAEEVGGVALFDVVLPALDDPGRPTEEQRQDSGRERIERATVPDTLRGRQPADQADDVVGGRTDRLVDDEDAVEPGPE